MWLIIQNVTSTQIEWASGQSIDHLVWEVAIQLYLMPVNFEKPTAVSLISSWQYARPTDIPYDPTESNTYWYNIIKSNWVTLIKIFGVENGSLTNNDLVKVDYIKKYAEMVAENDLCPFWEDYWIRVLAYIVAGGLWFDKGLINSQQHLVNGYGALTEMYGDYNDEINVITQTIKPKRYGFNSIRR